MYNRYIPQPDGSYRRNPTQEPRQHPQRSVQSKSTPPPKPPEAVYPPPHQHHPSQEPVSGFLRQLIPKGFDTGDLIVVLLLLLIAGDSQESRNHALLTLALYFIL